MARMADSYRDFWPLYLREHSRAGTRGLHYLGTGLGLGLLAAALVSGDWRLLPAALVSGYAFAWIGHALVERNRPATFSHPWWSVISDFRMFALWACGRLGRERARLGLAPDAARKAGRRREPGLPASH